MPGLRDTIRLGAVRGVAVGVHWSLLAIVVVVGAGLAQARLPLDVPGRSPGAYWATGAATALGLVLSVLAHEAAHAVVGRRAGLQVEGITLSWLGGVTRMGGDVRSPGWQAAVAGAGPAASALLGAVALAGSLASGGRGHLAGSALAWLGVINLALAAFNLLPATPLDGARVLQGLLWWRGGDRWRAAATTGRTSRAVGAVVVGVALWTLWVRADPVDGVTLAVLGGWIIASARAEASASAMARCLEGATVAHVMRPVGAAPGWISLRAFLDGYDASRPGWVWLLDGGGGRYAGVLSGEVARHVPAAARDSLSALDVAVPVADVVGAAPGDDAMTSLARTGGQAVLLVVDDDATVGAVLPADVAALVSSGRCAAPGAGRSAASVRRP